MSTFNMFLSFEPKVSVAVDVSLSMVFVSVSAPFVSTLLSHVVVMINDAPFLIVVIVAVTVVVVVAFA